MSCLIWLQITLNQNVSQEIPEEPGELPYWLGTEDVFPSYPKQRWKILIQELAKNPGGHYWLATRDFQTKDGRAIHSCFACWYSSAWCTDVWMTGCLQLSIYLPPVQILVVSQKADRDWARNLWDWQ